MWFHVLLINAAHCSWSTAGGFQIGALCAPYGPNDNQNCGQKVEQFGIAQVFDHDEYNGSTLNNDFSLIQLDGRSTIAPVLMDMGDISYDGGEELHPIGKSNRICIFKNIKSQEYHLPAWTTCIPCQSITIHSHSHYTRVLIFVIRVLEYRIRCY